MLVIVLAPAVALASSPSPSPTKQLVTQTMPASVLLAPGSGYRSQIQAAQVRALQRRLGRAGFSPGPIDGHYGPLTEHAVELLQAASGRRVDGIAGPLTLAALSAPAPTLYPGAGDQQADGSASVRSLQRLLAGAGDSPGPIDGRDGPLTIRAIEHFQTEHRLSIDGIAGPRTWQVLQAAGRPSRTPKTQPPAHHSTIKPQHSSAANPAHRNSTSSTTPKRVPGLPVGLVLLALVALGAATMSASYARARSRIRHARSTTQPAASRTGRAPIGAPPRTPAGSLAGNSQEDER